MALTPRRVPAQLALGVAAALIAVDAVWAVLYLAHWHVGAFASDRWDLSLEGSYAEWFQHGLELAIVAGLLVLHRRLDARHLLAWAATFAFVAVDDAFQLHEAGGHWLVTNLGSADDHLGLRVQDIGELVVWAAAGAFFAGLLLLTYRRADTDVQAMARQLAVVFALLVACGLLFDMADRLIDPADHRIVRVAVILEDGGELVALSLAAASVAAFLKPRDRSLSLQGA